MRCLCRLTVLALALWGSILVAGGRPQTGNVNELSLEVQALHILHELELSKLQCDAFLKLVPEVKPKPASAEAKVSPAYQKNLSALRGALVRSDDEKIAEIQDKLTQLQEKETPELDIAVEVTEGARAQARPALRLLTVRQLAVFIGTLDLADPVEVLIEGLDHVRSLKENKDEEIEQIAVEVSTIAAVGDEAIAKKVKEKAVALLNKAYGIKNDAAYKKQKPSLDQEARKLVGEMDSVAVLNRSLENGMAEFLSNPRLDAALKAMRNRKPPVQPKTTSPDKKKNG